MLLPAAPAQAAPDPSGPRAGSYFSGAPDVYGRVTARPYRRRQQDPARLPVNGSVAKFDYRIVTAPEAAALTGVDTGEDAFDHASIEPVGYCDAKGDCGDDACCGACVEPGCGCDDVCELGDGCDDVCGPGCACEPNYGCGDNYCTNCAAGDGGSATTWHVGFEWSFVKPRFSENIAFNTMEGDAANNSSFSDTEFDYDLELTPRVWIEARFSKDWSWRISYWQFDHAPATASGSPNANGFGAITPPAFGDVDISTTIPTDTFTASSHLNAYTIDIEALKQAQLNGWLLGVGGGVRYASAEQRYFAELRNAGNGLRGQIDYAHEIEGFGPTLGLSASRPLLKRVQLVCGARGSLLYGDGSSRSVAGEDLDLTNPFTTTRLTFRDDLLPVGEARVGLEWLSPTRRGSGLRWFLSTAMEGQLWGNAGSAASETADLGFFGFNAGAGFMR